MPISSRKIQKLLETDGWVQVKAKGGHLQFKHPTKPGRVTLPAVKRDLPKGTVAAIERQAGIKMR